MSPCTSRVKDFSNLEEKKILPKNTHILLVFFLLLFIFCNIRRKYTKDHDSCEKYFDENNKK